MAVHWRKSSYCSNEMHCVELGRLASAVDVGVRDSKDPVGGHLSLTPAEFAALLTRIKHAPSP